MASAKACDAVFHVDRPARPRSCGSCCTSASTSTDHTTHFYILGGPDFIVGPDAPPAERNILGVIDKVGVEIGGKVIEHARHGQEIIEMLGGKPIHPVGAFPGGDEQGPEPRGGASRKSRHGEDVRGVRQVHPAGSSTTSCSANQAYVDLILSEPSPTRPTTWAWWTSSNQVNFYDGTVRVVDPDGKEFAKYRARRLPGPHRRARRALDLPQVPLPEEDRLEGPRGRRGQRRLPGHAAGPPQRRRRDGDAAGPGGVRADVRDAGRQAGASDAWPPTGRG